MAGSNRRNFFRQAAAEAVRGARQVIPFVDPLADLVETSPAPATKVLPPAEEKRRIEPATPTSHSASVDEMLAIAREFGLASRTEDLRRLAVSSARITPTTDAGGSSFAGGEPTVPAAVGVPDFEGGPARFVALLDLPESGRLWIFRSAPDPGNANLTEASDAASLQAGAVFEASSACASSGLIPHPVGARSLSTSRELTLPRPWSTAVEPLVLSPAEQDSWQDLRTRLAAIQGVPLGESAQPYAAIHRICGYPDERRGDMPLICELRLLGVDLGGRPPAAHPLAGALEGKSGNWRLLAQLAADDELGWSWGSRFQRLYVWGHSEDPASDEYDSVQAVIQ